MARCQGSNQDGRKAVDAPPPTQSLLVRSCASPATGQQPRTALLCWAAERLRVCAIRAGVMPSRGKRAESTASAGGESVAAYVQRWLENRERRGLSSVGSDRARMKLHILPSFEGTTINAVSKDDVRGAPPTDAPIRWEPFLPGPGPGPAPARYALCGARVSATFTLRALLQATGENEKPTANIAAPNASRAASAASRGHRHRNCYVDEPTIWALVQRRVRSDRTRLCTSDPASLDLRI